MKTSKLLIAVLSVLLFSCGSPETDSQKEAQRPLAVQNEIMDLVASPDFKEAMKQELASSTARGTEANRGVRVINNNAGTLIFFFDMPDNKMLLCGAADTSGTIAILPNGTARFTIRSNEPFAYIFDLNTFELLLANESDLDKAGSMFSNVLATYEIVNYGFGDVYRISQPRSASVFRLNTTVSDALFIYDEFYNIIGVKPETQRKNLSVRSVNAPNSNGNGSFNITLN